jgi:hypothetical protein
MILLDADQPVFLLRVVDREKKRFSAPVARSARAHVTRGALSEPRQLL